MELDLSTTELLSTESLEANEEGLFAPMIPTVEPIDEPAQVPMATSCSSSTPAAGCQATVHHPALQGRFVVPPRLLHVHQQLEKLDNNDDEASIAALQQMALPQMTGQIRDIEQARAVHPKM